MHWPQLALLSAPAMADEVLDAVDGLVAAGRTPQPGELAAAPVEPVEPGESR